ncbi:hypothetical protein C0Q70_02643 [Pomacea canaliculata]|uniref:Signal transducer and activator of transcription n=1 Tax=Pomacea canaliculata TaxID=400727 RepID=A0A2T7PQL2_POMCA|nr:hypothetical protein C0Q70_02643 [Pomacea canaliculata]
MKKMQEVYGQHFPIEVRYFLCQFIEERDWHSIDVKDPNNEVQAKAILNEFLTHLQTKTQELTGDNLFPVRMRLEHAITTFQALYQENALGFVGTVRDCLDKETMILEVLRPESPEEMDDESEQPKTAGKIIQAELEELTKKTMNAEQKLKELQNKQEYFIIQYQENIKISGHLAAVQKEPATRERQDKEAILRRQKEQVEMMLSQQAQQLLHYRVKQIDLYEKAIQALEVVQKQVLDEELIGWKRQQQLAGNGLSLDEDSLDDLQQWCERLSEVIWSIRQQIKKLGILIAQLPINLPDGQKNLLPELSDTITGLLSSLVTSTFIVEQQPPQVLKKESRFSATVRLLVGGKLNVHMNPPQVKATIISEHQAKCLLSNDINAKSEKSGEILNNCGTMEYHSGSGELSVNFRNMQLKQIKRSDKKGSEAVTEEKFCILFTSDFNVGGNDLVFQVWTLSLPVVVTVHGNQECNALATVLWDNAFSEPGRQPFAVPESVPWPKLGEQLCLKFRSATGRGLSDDNLNYLASKIFGMASINVRFNFTLVCAKYKETLRDRNFTFWEWFYAVLKLTKEHLKGPWCDGSIMGFVSKLQAQEWLNQKPNGTFLLRFSDSECGGITIAWIAESNARSDEREVWNLAPFIARDFSIRGLADRIKDLNNLTFLYPDISKDFAFGRYYTSTQDQPPATNGYIRPHLVNVISMPCPPINDYEPHRPAQIISPYSPPNPGSSVPPTPQSNPSDDFLADDTSSSLTDILCSTDYDTDDIIHINVNQLLHNFNFGASS